MKKQFKVLVEMKQPFPLIGSKNIAPRSGHVLHIVRQVVQRKVIILVEV